MSRKAVMRDKSAWGPGPWQDEPDEVRWRDDATGYDCLLRRNSLGAWCGYVAVPEGHPLHGVGYSAPQERLQPWLQRRLEQPVGEQPSFSVLLGLAFGRIEPTVDAVVVVHGGVTYAGSLLGDQRWWFGFDCSHADDYGPGEATRVGLPPRPGTYRTMEYAREQTTALARQLAEMARPWEGTHAG